MGLFWLWYEVVPPSSVSRCPSIILIGLGLLYAHLMILGGMPWYYLILLEPVVGMCELYFYRARYIVLFVQDDSFVFIQIVLFYFLRSMIKCWPACVGM